jgi:circadian clock protein KaiC
VGERIKSGIAGMDDILGGGFIPGTVILVSGLPGTGKSTFCREMVKNHSGVGCLMVVTNIDATRLKEDLGKSAAGNVAILNSFSKSVAQGAATSLNDFKAGFEKALGGNKLVVIDSLTDLLFQNEPEQVYKLLQLLVGIIRSEKPLMFVCMDTGICEPSAENMMAYATDGTIEMKLEGNQRLLRVTRMNGTPHPLEWLPFTIGEKGMDVRVKEFLR